MEVVIVAMGRRALLHKGNASKVLAQAGSRGRKAKVRAVHGRSVAHVPKEDLAQKDNVVHGPREALAKASRLGQKAREVAIAARGQRGNKAHGRSVDLDQKAKAEAVAAVAVAEGVAIVHQVVVERGRHPILP